MCSLCHGPGHGVCSYKNPNREFSELIPGTAFKHVVAASVMLQEVARSLSCEPAAQHQSDLHVSLHFSLELHKF